MILTGPLILPGPLGGNLSSKINVDVLNPAIQDGTEFTHYSAKTFS